MQEIPLTEARPVIKAFYRAIDARIPRGFTKFGPDGRKTDGFIFVLDGNAHYKLNNYTLDVKTGDMFYLSRSACYSMTVKSDLYHVLIANFDFQIPENTRLRCAISPLGNVKNAEKLFRGLLSTWQLQSATVHFECLSALYLIYSLFLNSTGNTYLSSIKRLRMSSALRYINEHLGEDSLSVPEVAAAVNLSESHFRRSFRETYNISPVQYINMQRVTQAKESIRYTNDSFAEIAESLGFSSIYHFSHTFKKEVGYSPSEYRKHYNQYPKT